MSVTDYSDPLIGGTWAKQWSEDLLRKEHRGPGDTIEAAAGRLEKRRKVDARVLLQGWYRPPANMKVSRWLPLYFAWWEEVGRRSEASYGVKREEAKAHGCHPALLRLADTVAGHLVGETAEEDLTADES